MHRSLLIILCALGSVLMALAQRQYAPEFYIGGHGGATLSRIELTPAIQQGFLPGMIVGVTARYTEENHFGIIAELNLQQRGWQEKYLPDQDFSYSRRLTYIQLPLLTHIYFGNRKWRGYVNLGPEVGYMIASGTKSNFDYHDIASVPGYPTTNRESRQLDMEISNRFDYGISAGLGMETFIGRRNSLTLEGRFYYGIGNIFPAAKSDVFGSSRSWSIEVMAGYWFRVR